MIRLKSEPEPRPRPRSRWGRRVLLLFPLVIAVALLAEHWRGQRALAVWQRDSGAQGEVVDVARLWPAVSTTDAEFSNQLAQAVEQLPPRLCDYAGSLDGVVLDVAGMARRGSQEPRPQLEGEHISSSSWAELESSIREGDAAFRALRQLMKRPAKSMGCGFAESSGGPFAPKFNPVSRAALALHAAALSELHHTNHTAALQNLEALSAFPRLYADEPLLVAYMIRITALCLSDDAYWDALQDEGWTEPQLARLQQACQCDELLPALPRTFEAEHALHVHSLRWLAAHSYEDWLCRHQGRYDELGITPPASDTAGVVRLWRQWVFHPLWRFAWADQEELHYRQVAREQVSALRDAAERRAWVGLGERIQRSRDQYPPPALAWRFYTYPAFVRAPHTAMRNLTRHEMVKTVIALKRYKLRHGEWPANLAALTPEFLPAVPRDLMDGKELRYQPGADGAFALYSVATDGEDNGGDPSPVSSDQSRRDNSEWGGRDWVWPQLANKTTRR